MAVLKFTNSKSSLKKLIQYITQAEKTEEKLVSGKDCISSSAYDEMMTVKQMHGKNVGRKYIHVIQSFDIQDQVSYQKAHEIGLELANAFQGFQVLVATHKDRDHIHNHLLINSVNFETGLKFQQSKRDLENMKTFSDELCRAAGLSVIEKRGDVYISRAEYKAAEKGESWKWKLISTLDEALKQAQSKDEFIKIMKFSSYEVIWTDKRKNITFITPEGFKCRDTKLHDIKYTKEEILNGTRRQRIGNRESIGKEEVGDGEQGRRYAARNQAGGDKGRVGYGRGGRTDQAVNRSFKRISGGRGGDIDEYEGFLRFIKGGSQKLKRTIHRDERSR